LTGAALSHPDMAGPVKGTNVLCRVIEFLGHWCSVLEGRFC
jgi:hypothetical protein